MSFPSFMIFYLKSLCLQNIIFMVSQNLMLSKKRYLNNLSSIKLGSPGGSDGKESACSTGDPGSIPESGRSPGGGHGNLLQYSRLENPMDRGAWRAVVHGIVSQTRMINWTPTKHRHHLGRPWGQRLFFWLHPRASWILLPWPGIEPSAVKAES